MLLVEEDEGEGVGRQEILVVDYNDLAVLGDLKYHLFVVPGQFDDF